MHNVTYFKINSLRQTSMVKAVEGIAVLVFSFFLTALLPSIIFRLFYAQADLLEQPKVFEYIPIITFALGTGYFLYVMTGNFLRSRKIRQLEAELNIETNSGSGDSQLTKFETMASKKIASAKRMSKSKRSKSSKR